MKARIALALLAAVTAAGCTRAQYVARPVVLPTLAPPVLTSVKASDVQCLADDVYTTLVQRERLTWDWGAAQAAVIRANNAAAGAK